MTPSTPLAFVADARSLVATVPGARWLDRVTVWTPADPDEFVTGEVETAVIVLAGTFDLVANGTAWPARGARAEQFAGRPMAVYLPPHTTFRVSKGSGRLLLVSARRPATGQAPTGREALATKPLLPLAGSGKAFDPTSGEWRPAETFPTAPESLPPRRFARLPVGGCVIERVFAADYKAATLCLDEVVVPAGVELALAAVPDRPPGDEMLLFVDTECEALVGTDTRVTKLHGPGAFWLAPEQFACCTVRAIDHRAYVAIAYAGKPASGS